QRPRLILSYLHGPDSAGHLEGPEAPAVMERVRQTDQVVERLLRALEGVPRSALVVVSDQGMAPVSRLLRTAVFPRARPARRARVMHGYRPEEKSMQGIFRAWGAGVRRGSRSDSIRAVDVAPFVCRLLGIECPPGIDGRAPEELLAGADSGPASERGPTPSGS